jgi:hypothetical protein
MFASLLFTPCLAQEEAAEPIELTRLREQFSNRIEQEMKPWRDRYAQELQKLEDRLIKDRKLTEALAVKKEKDNYMQADLSKKPEKVAVPATAEKAKEAMIGSVWLVYDVADKKRENILDTYHFVDGKSVYVLTSKKLFTWSAKSHEQVVIEFAPSNIELDVYFDKNAAEMSFQSKNYVVLMVGKSKR